MGTRELTLADVARLAGVSEITVSRVLRDRGPISAKTRQRVLAAVEQTGYVLNPLAGALASAGSKLVGVVLPSLSNLVFPEVLRGIEESCQKSRHRALVTVTEYDLEQEEAAIASLLAWKPAAMIVTGQQHTDRTRRLLVASGVRVAELMGIDEPALDVAVGLSHVEAGKSTAKHLWSRGYRDFAFVGHDLNRDHRAALRRKGLIEELVARGASLRAEARSERASSVPLGRELTQQLLSREPRPDVIVYANDDLALGGVFHCWGAAIQPKADIALFGFNGLDIGQVLPQPLSTLRSRRFETGRLAAQMLLDVEQSPPRGLAIDLGYELLEGATA